MLLFALEGPSDQESFRYSHPYQIVSSLLQQDTTIGLADIIRQQLPVSIFSYLIRSTLFLKEGIVDKIFRSNAVSLLTHLLGAQEMYYFYPSLAPMHQHSIPQTISFRKQRESEDTNAKLSSQKLFSLCKEDLLPLIDHICETIYKTSRDDLLPCGDTGRCYFARIARLLTVLADLDDILVW